METNSETSSRLDALRGQVVALTEERNALAAAVLAMEAFIRADDVPMPVSLIDQWRAAVAKAAA